MNLRIKILYFGTGINAMGGAKSVSHGQVSGGPRAAKSIKRVQGGYVVDWNGVNGGNTGLFFVPDGMVECALVEDADKVPETIAEPTPEPVAAPLPSAATAMPGPIPTLSPDTAPGTIVLLPSGMYGRAPGLPKAAEPVSDEAPAHTVRRKGRDKSIPEA